MKGLKIIPVFVVFLVLTYLGVLFVNANSDPVVVRLLRWESPPVALGLVLLTAVLIGMVAAGALCSIELILLALENRKLRRRAPRHVGGRTGSGHEPLPDRFPTEMGESSTGSHAEPTPEGTDPGDRNRFNPL